jgi:serine/threonine-protein kinase HipA
MPELPAVPAVTVRLGGRVVGRLALTPERLCAFQYDADYLRDGSSVSPLKLPLEPRVFVARRAPFGGGFGVFDDSLPDGWGRLVQDRYLRGQGIDPDGLTIPQRLALVGGGGRGALEYAPALDVATPAPLDLGQLAEYAAATESLLAAREVPAATLEAVYLASGSSGGARPKANVLVDGREWLVKFPAGMDRPGIGELEYECSLLAADCGIEMAATRLFDGKYFGTARFDRPDGGKAHMASAAALLDADYRLPALDYEGLLALTRVLTRDMSQVRELFTRMVLNVVVGNRDDHARNFSYLMDDAGRWRLSPAYDIVPSSGFGGQHTTTVHGTGDPGPAEVLAVADSASIPAKRARSIMAEVTAAARARGLASHPLD